MSLRKFQNLESIYEEPNTEDPEGDDEEEDDDGGSRLIISDLPGLTLK